MHTQTAHSTRKRIDYAIHKTRDLGFFWQELTDSFAIGEEFTMREAIFTVWPDMQFQQNNVSYYAKKLAAMFDEIHNRTLKEYGEPHIRCVRGRNKGPSSQVWVL